MNQSTDADHERNEVEAMKSIETQVTRERETKATSAIFIAPFCYHSSRVDYELR